MSERGLILVNTGNGKGKTTAALGVVLRAVGQGLKVLILQFIKSGHGYGELEGLKKLGDAVTIKSMGKGFIYYNRDKVTVEELEKHKAAAQEAWKTLVEEVNSDKWDLIVMDEINNAINYELIDVNFVVDMLKQDPDRFCTLRSFLPVIYTNHLTWGHTDDRSFLIVIIVTPIFKVSAINVFHKSRY